MKPLNLLLLVISLSGLAQEMHTRSNDIYLSFNQPRNHAFFPVILWMSPKGDYSQSKTNQVNVAAEIVSNSASLKNILISIGDNLSGEVWGVKELNLPGNRLTYSLKLNVFLPEGSNYIQIAVENTDGSKISSTRTVFVGKRKEEWVDATRKDYALLFATNNYDSWDRLVNPIADAKAIAQKLQAEYNFEVELVENANQDEIIEKIRDLSTQTFKAQDQLFIFFAGHGQFDDILGEGYVVARNSKLGDKARTSYLSHSNLRTYINNIPCKHILLTMDVCFGGTFDPQIARTRGAADDLSEGYEIEFLARKLSKTTRLYVTSGGKEYVPDGAPGHNSPFASRLLEALQSRGGSDRILTIAEIKSFLEKIEMNEPRFGDFGDNETGSDFVFVAKPQ